MPSSASRASPRLSHSFPTRRSSDLRLHRGDCIRAVLQIQPASSGPAALSGRSRRSQHQRAVSRIHRRQQLSERAHASHCDRLRASRRSEEHTSELQSLRHLVCRLLLLAPPPASPTLSLHDALPIFVFIAAIAFELFYRFNLHHPGPPRSLAEADGPSISELFPGSTGGNSFPSGHMLRTVIVYGLLADRKSTRLNSSHLGISYAVFCFSRLPPPLPLFPYTTLFRSSSSSRRLHSSCSTDSTCIIRARRALWPKPTVPASASCFQDPPAATAFRAGTCFAL